MEVLMQPYLFWAIVLGVCFIALALIVIPSDAGVFKDREGDLAAHHLRYRPVPIRQGQPGPVTPPDGPLR